MITHFNCLKIINTNGVIICIDYYLTDLHTFTLELDRTKENNYVSIYLSLIFRL